MDVDETKVWVAVLAIIITLSNKIPPIKKHINKQYKKYVLSRKRPLIDLDEIINDKNLLKVALKKPTQENIAKDRSRVSEILRLTTEKGSSVKKLISKITLFIQILSLSIIFPSILLILNTNILKINWFSTVLEFIYKSGVSVSTLGNGLLGTIVLALILVAFIIKRTYGLHIMASESYKEMNNIVLSRIQERTIRAIEISRDPPTPDSDADNNDARLPDCSSHCDNFKEKVVH